MYVDRIEKKIGAYSNLMGRRSIDYTLQKILGIKNNGNQTATMLVIPFVSNVSPENGEINPEKIPKFFHFFADFEIF